MLSAAPASLPLPLPLHLTLRNISCPEDTHAQRKVLIGACYASELLRLLPEGDAEPSSPERAGDPAAVEDAVLFTLRNSPYLFPVLNRGVTLVVSHADIDDARRTIRIAGAQLVDGVSTLKCLRAHVRSGSAADPSVRLEIIVAANADLAADIEASRRQQRNTSHLLTRATATVADVLDVDASEQEVLQVASALIALMPPTIFTHLNVGESKSALLTSRRQCMAALADALAEQEVLSFCRQMQPTASAVDTYWRGHPALLNGAPYMTEGLLLPLLSSLSAYVVEVADETASGASWSFVNPSDEAEAMLSAEALGLLETAGGDTFVMGTRTTSYNILHLAARLLRDQSSFEEAA